jgi:hypothetical protein
MPSFASKLLDRKDIIIFQVVPDIVNVLAPDRTANNHIMVGPMSVNERYNVGLMEIVAVADHYSLSVRESA